MAGATAPGARPSSSRRLLRSAEVRPARSCQRVRQPAVGAAARHGSIYVGSIESRADLFLADRGESCVLPRSRSGTRDRLVGMRRRTELAGALPVVSRLAPRLDAVKDAPWPRFRPARP